MTLEPIRAVSLAEIRDARQRIAGQGFDVDYLRWSADGRTLYASGSYPDRRHSILAVPGDGGPPREVVRSEGPAEQTFRFSFDIHGNTAYISLADRQSDIWTAEVETGP